LRTAILVSYFGSGLKQKGVFMTVKEFLSVPSDELPRWRIIGARVAAVGAVVCFVWAFVLALYEAGLRPDSFGA
jgi:hypothetical protein